jgi:hypothetical protein
MIPSLGEQILVRIREHLIVGNYSVEAAKDMGHRPTNC